MKLFLSAMLSVLAIFPAFSGKHRATEIDKVDKFRIEGGMGIPIRNYNADDDKEYCTDDILRLNIGCNWKLASGIMHTKHFGRNGGIDFGFQYNVGYHYGYKFDTDIWKEHVVMKDLGNMITDYDVSEPCFTRHRFVTRINFHFQFLKRMDTYAGMFGGFGIVRPDMDEEYVVSAKTYTERSWGCHAGVTWYFTSHFGVGLEWENDMEGIYGINGSGNTLNLKFNYLFNEQSEKERAMRKKKREKERNIKRLMKEQRELEEWILK